MCFGGDTGTQTTTQQTSTAPWEPQQAPLEAGFEAAAPVLDTPREYFPGSTVTPFSGQTQQALGGIENQAQAGNPLYQQAQDEVGKTLSGEYLNQENPAYQGMVDRAVRPMTEAYQNEVVPGIDSTFAASGRYGSQAGHGQARQNAAQNYERQVGDVGAQLSGANYAQERQNQQNAVGMAPGAAEGAYADLNKLLGVGGAYESQQQAETTDEVSRYNFEQNELANRIGDYMSLIGGGYGSTGSQSTTQPTQGGSNLLTGLGAGMTGLSGLNTAFNPSTGLWPNAF